MFSFLRIRTWLDVRDPLAAVELYDDAAWLARKEGLEAHARSAERRIATQLDSANSRSISLRGLSRLQSAKFVVSNGSRVFDYAHGAIHGCGKRTLT